MFVAQHQKMQDVLFGSRKYSVPRYQRPYAWGLDQATEFWEDLTSKNKLNFLGSMIVKKKTKDGDIELIDGQQRLLTITILCASMRDFMRDHEKDAAYSSVIQRTDIAFEDENGENQFVRVTPAESLKEFFLKHIQTNTKSLLVKKETDTDEKKRVLQIYQYFYERLIEHTKDLPQKKSAIMQLRKSLRELLVILIEIDDEEDAYEIFETTNARGLDLSVSDLIKNLIFKTLQPQRGIDTPQDLWQEVVSNVEGSNVEMKKFIRHFWLSKHSFITEKQLYREVKIKIKDRKGLLSDLVENSRLYSLLNDGNEEDFQFEYGKEIFPSVFAIRFMKVTQCYVLMLSILRNIDRIHTNPMRVFTQIEKFSFVYSTISKLPTNKVERIYSNYAIEIEKTCSNSKLSHSKIQSRIQSLFDTLIKELNQLMPNKEFFIDYFSDFGYKKSEDSRKLIKYILSKINYSYSATDEMLINFDTVNIEHILPQNPSKDWKMSKKQIKSYVNKIGNLTLLSKRINGKIQNSSLDKKIIELEKSELSVTKKLVEALKNNNLIWGQKEIEERQQKLALTIFNDLWK